MTPPTDLDPGWRLRPATADDDRALRSVFAATHPGLSALPLPADQVASVLRQQVDARDAHRRSAHPDAERSVVEIGGKAVGLLVVDHTDDHAHVVTIELHPSVQGMGIGTAVLRSVLARADREGVPTRLEVAIDNPDARRLYERLGFEPVIAADPATPIVDLPMERPCPISPT